MRFRHTVKLSSFFSRLMVKRWLLHDLDVQPVVAELFLTDNCNLRCVSCACWRSQTQDELTCQEWCDVIRQLGDLGFVKLNFTGGEALLRRDFENIVRFASTYTDAELHLNTNAILLTPPKTRRLIDAGIRSFNISFDGATPQTHDDIRGLPGAFERTMENFQELVKLKNTDHLKLRMCFTVMRQNVGELRRMAKLAQQMKVRLFFNVLTDHTFLFRGHGRHPVQVPG
jgi:MoaA/NifB/PqqE/SkfB family radical SAM enzyme